MIQGDAGGTRRLKQSAAMKKAGPGPGNRAARVERWPQKEGLRTHVVLREPQFKDVLKRGSHMQISVASQRNVEKIRCEKG
jgi:hypothetical protein